VDPPIEEWQIVPAPDKNFLPFKRERMKSCPLAHYPPSGSVATIQSNAAWFDNRMNRRRIAGLSLAMLPLTILLRVHGSNSVDVLP
jgi:hypothetical protein